MGNAGKKNKPRFPRSKYTVGWICALDLEMSASMAMFDERHGQAEDLDPGDTNTYQFGQIGPHKIVIACLGTYGTSSATEVATNMVRSFRSLTIRLMVGIAGGVPSKVHDIRLGDVVVSRPGKDAAVIQYDFGKSTDSGNFVPTGLLSNPPPKLLSALSAIRADHMLDGGSISIFTEHLKDLPAYFQHPGAKAADRLYAFNYKHVAGDSNCDECDQKQEVKRPPRDSTLPFVHYGAVGSGNQVMKDGVKRDELRDKHGILCFEMEAAGLMNSFPCLVIRGICDYSDSHKHKEWQPYAAATAAAYAKCLLGMIPSDGVTGNAMASQHLIGTLDKTKNWPEATGMNTNLSPGSPSGNAKINKIKRAYPNGLLGYIPIAAVESLEWDKVAKLDCDLVSIKNNVDFLARLDTNKDFRLRFERNIAKVFPPYPVEAVGCLGGRPSYLESIAQELDKSLEDVKWEIGGFGMWAVESYFALCRYRGLLDFDEFKWLC